MSELGIGLIVALILAVVVASVVWLRQPRRKRGRIVVGAEGVEEAVILRCWGTGKTIVGTVHDDGTIEIEEYD